MKKCPSCEVELEPLIEELSECPRCKKVFKDNLEKDEEKGEEEKQDGSLKDNITFNLNQQYEVPEKGIPIKDGKFAVLICHAAKDESDRYIRLSWWKDSYMLHKGMIKIKERTVLNNMIKALEKIDEVFDDFWDWRGNKSNTKTEKTEEQKKKEKQHDIIKYRIIENKTCPNCQKTMKKFKTHYDCSHCGELVILEGYNQPIFNRDSNDLDLSFDSNLPIHHYLCETGITIKWFMGEWKAVAVIYSKDNPNKRWLRFYWWDRDFSKYLKMGRHEIGEGIQMGWKAKRGTGQTNVYDKKLIKLLIEGLKKFAQELNREIE